MARPPSPARLAAYRVLEAVARRKANPADVLHRDEGRALGPADADLATEIVYGVLRWQAKLDFILGAHARRPAEDIDLPLLLCLRMGLYQLRRLDRIPPHSAVDESVRLARRFGPRGAHAFVNAVLRSASRRPGHPRLPRKDADPLGYLATTLSHPEWLARRYLSRWGIDIAEAVCRRNNETPPTDVRVEPPRSTEEARAMLAREGVRAEPLRGVPGCLRVSSGKPAETALFREGGIYIQEAGSQLIPPLLGVAPGQRVLDACAAPGGKATAMAPWARPGSIVAVDRRPRRLAVLAAFARRLGHDNVIAVAADAARLPFRISFDRILLDAPCSSLGTLARNPDLKWKIQEEDLSSYAATQIRLLASCAEALAPGGRLVYATCSTEPEENEQAVAEFLEREPAFHRMPAPPDFPAPALLEPDGAFRTRPDRDALDGYYAVVLARV